MSLNKYMHPRNKYKTKKPSFLELAMKYPDFRKQVTQDESGKVFLDFKNADALRALTTCLLKEDFDLTVHLPSDRLVPTLPLRLNYIHWLEDIIGTESGKWGIDVGTGASCVYPLVAAKMKKWNFLATESDMENFFHAQKNVESNNLQDLIHVKQVSVEDALSGPTESFNLVNTFDFCMCNPPFFADHMEAQAVSSSRSVDRPEANSMSTASPQECIAKGGEVGFIRQMIEESTVLRNKIRLYSSMVGKKTSLTQLKEELRHQQVPKFATTEFCQGKTMRWGIAWSFDDAVHFPKSQFETRKEKAPLNFVIPKGAGGVEYKVHAVANFLKDILTSIKIHCYQGKTAKSYTSITLTATENTWIHQRRRRRQQKRQEQEQTVKSDSKETQQKEIESDNLESQSNERVSECLGEPDKDSVVSSNDVKTVSDLNSSDAVGKDRKRLMIDEDNHSEMSPAKVMRCDVIVDNHDSEVVNRLNDGGDKNCSEGSCETLPLPTSRNVSVDEGSSLSISKPREDESTKAAVTGECVSPKDYIVKCVMRLKRAGENITMEMEWLDGVSRELMHQIKTFLVNKLGEKKSQSF